MPHNDEREEHHDHRATLGKHVSLNRLAFSATVHCLTGCSIGEVLGTVMEIVDNISRRS